MGVIGVHAHMGVMCVHGGAGAGGSWGSCDLGEGEAEGVNNPGARGQGDGTTWAHAHMGVTRTWV